MKEANGTKEYQMRQSYGEKKCFCINLPERLPVQGMFTCEYFCMTLDGPLFSQTWSTRSLADARAQEKDFVNVLPGMSVPIKRQHLIHYCDFKFTQLTEIL